MRAACFAQPLPRSAGTCCCREMQGRRGAGRKLRDLSAEKLGRRIQLSGRRHSPRRVGSCRGGVAWVVGHELGDRQL